MNEVQNNEVLEEAKPTGLLLGLKEDPANDAYWKVKSTLMFLANKLSEIMDNPSDPDVRLKLQKVKSEIEPITDKEIELLSDDDIDEFGLGLWAEDDPVDGKALYLLPRWLFSCIDGNTKLTCVDGTQLLAKDADDETRGGFVAYGVIRHTRPNETDDDDVPF